MITLKADIQCIIDKHEFFLSMQYNFQPFYLQITILWHGSMPVVQLKLLGNDLTLPQCHHAKYSCREYEEMLRCCVE